MNTENTEVAVKEQNNDVLNQNNLLRTAGMPSTNENLPAKSETLPEQSGNYGCNENYGNGYYNNQNGYQNNNGYDQFSDYYAGLTEYPTLTCKSAGITFWNVVFPGIFAFVFLVLPAIVSFGISKTQGVSAGLFIIPFLLIGAIAAGISIFTLAKFFLVTRKGKKITGLVCGYSDDNVVMNGRPAQVVRLLINTPIGKRYIMYRLGNASQPYAIHSMVSLLAYKNYFKIVDNEEKIEW